MLLRRRDPRSSTPFSVVGRSRRPLYAAYRQLSVQLPSYLRQSRQPTAHPSWTAMCHGRIPFLSVEHPRRPRDVPLLLSWTGAAERPSHPTGELRRPMRSCLVLHWRTKKGWTPCSSGRGELRLHRPALQPWSLRASDPADVSETQRCQAGRLFAICHSSCSKVVQLLAEARRSKDKGYELLIAEHLHRHDTVDVSQSSHATKWGDHTRRYTAVIMPVHAVEGPTTKHPVSVNQDI